MERLRRNLRGGTIVGVLLLFAAASGCATYPLQIASPDPLDDRDVRGEVVDAWFWGLYRSPHTLVAEDQGHGISDVEVKTNYGYALVTVISLGIYMPVEIRYRVKAPTGDFGDPE